MKRSSRGPSLRWQRNSTGGTSPGCGRPQARGDAWYRFTLKGPDTLRVSVYSQDRQADGTTQLSLQASDVNPYLTDLATTLAANRTTLVVVVINAADGGDEATFSLKVEPGKQL